MRLTLKYKSAVKTRSDLFSLLSEACELEHGLACSYLYSAFSLKDKVAEGITGEQLQVIRKWAAKIFFIGGTPYYFRPNFPQPSKYYPFNVPLRLEPFSLEALQRFILYELPSNEGEKEYAKSVFGMISEDDYEYKTVGELYNVIREGFNSISEKELFIGNPDLQMGQDEIDFHEIIKVVDRKTANEAISMITEQGEGVKDHREDSHYEMFRKIESEYKEFIVKYENFQPARATVINPITFQKGNYSSADGEIIINPTTREISDLFDDIYNLMLRALQYSFCYCDDKSSRKLIAGFAIQLMVRVIKPLGECLTMLPAFPDPYLRKAGPSFALTRHIPLPPHSELSKQLLRERGNELLERMGELSKLEPKLLAVYSPYSDVLKVLEVSS
jgi:Ferritin-like